MRGARAAIAWLTPARLRRAWPWALFVTTPLLVYPLDFIGAGMLDGGDDAFANLPMLYYSARQFLAGELLWAPPLWLGGPLLAEPEYATFYPLRFLVLVLPPVLGFAVYQLLHYALAQAAAYLYLRGLRLRLPAAVFGALIYGYAGFMLGHRGHSMYLVAGAWAPLFLLCVHRFAQRQTRRWAVAAVCCYLPLPFSGAFQLALYLSVAAAILFGVISLLERDRRWIVSLLVIGIPCGLIAALQLFPSFELAGELSFGRREDFGFATALSWHPALLGQLFLPGFIEAEWYSRIGSIGLAAAITGGLLRRRNSVARAWLVVAGVALLLMLGHNVEPLARLLHELPVVGVFRAPIRHNFELGLATAVLGAFGLDGVLRLGRLPPRGWAAWLFGLCLLVIFAAWLGPAWEPEIDAVRYWLTNVTNTQVLVALALMASFVLLIHLRGPGRWRVALLAALALAETAVSARSQIRLNAPEGIPDRFAQLERMREVFARHPVPRVLAPKELSTFDSLAGNAVLLSDGIQRLTGYGSAAPADCVSTLTLDMHGYPRILDTLRFSSVPSVFGVTHMIMPRFVCGADRASFPDAFAPEAGCDVSSLGGRSQWRVTPCELPDRATPVPIFLELAARVDEEPTVLRVVVSGRRSDDVATRQWERQLLEVKPAGGVAHRRWLPFPNTMLGNSRADIAFGNGGAGPLTLEVAAVVTFADLLGNVLPTADAPRTAEGEPVIRLRADDGLAQVSTVLRPPDDFVAREPLVLEIWARAREPLSDQLVVDLYGGPEFDPEAGQLLIEPRELGPELRRYYRIVRLKRLPRDLFLRAFYRGEGELEIASVRLWRKSDRADLLDPNAVWSKRRGVEVNADGAVLAPEALLEFPFFLPIRPLKLRLVAKSAEGFPIRIHAEPQPPQGEPPYHLWWAFNAGLEKLLGVFESTQLISPQLRDVRPQLIADPAHWPEFSTFELVDGCAGRHYVPEAPLSSGLWLYRNEDALPRVYFAEKTVGVDDLGTVRRTLFYQPAFKPGKMALVSGQKGRRSFGIGRILSTEFETSDVTLEVVAPAEGAFLVINDRYHPGWEAQVDGQPATLLRTNGLVRGLQLEPGAHRVTMTFRASLWVWLGLFAALLGVVLLAADGPGRLLRYSTRGG